jgi:membrane protein DedA with SNARE-associated domain
MGPRGGTLGGDAASWGIQRVPGPRGALASSAPKRYAGRMGPLPLLLQAAASAASEASGVLEQRAAELAAWLGSLPDGLRGVALAVATFISEDLTTVFAGLLVAREELSFTTALVACTLGIWIGDGGIWALGRYLGRPMLQMPVLRHWIRKDSITRAERWFGKRGLRVVLVSRFLPGSRVAAFFAAGLLGARAGWFLGWALLAAMVWTPLLILAAIAAAPQLESWIGSLLQLEGAWKLLPPLLSFGALIFVLRMLEVLTDWRSRRLFRARWVRRLHWEFWPPWVFYGPCVGWYLGLALRHRSLTLPTVANPGMDAGGFIGESKGEILERLVAGRGEAQRFVARTLRLPAALAGGRPDAAAAEARWPGVAAWMALEEVPFPLVLKPDVGQRGSGVRLVRTEAEARDYLRAMPLAAVAQEYAPGPHELGVFWARAPGEARGRILSVTEKFFPEVVGDGDHDLHDLILLHPRAVLQSRVFFRRHADVLDWVPGPGARFPLVTSGNHCQGTLFKDGARLGSEALRARLDELADGHPGLHAGRFDLRAPDLEALQRGEGFRIVELNGATAEATHIYDPALGPWRGPVVAWRTLFAQWSLMFRLGAANRAAGHRPLGAWALLARWREYRRLQKWHPHAS